MRFLFSFNPYKIFSFLSGAASAKKLGEEYALPLANP